MGEVCLADEFILETHGLTKEFAGFFAVRDVSLKVRRGSIHALIGPNGAGKTTCFNLLTKFLQPTAGNILYNVIQLKSGSKDWFADDIIDAFLIRVSPFNSIEKVSYSTLTAGAPLGNQLCLNAFHANLDGTSPNYRQRLQSAPRAVVLHFDQSVQAEPNAIVVKNEFGKTLSASASAHGQTVRVPLNHKGATPEQVADGLVYYLPPVIDSVFPGDPAASGALALRRPLVAPVWFIEM